MQSPPPAAVETPTRIHLTTIPTVDPAMYGSLVPEEGEVDLGECTTADKPISREIQK